MGLQGPWVIEKMQNFQEASNVDLYTQTCLSAAGHVPTHLHSNDGIDEEQHGDEQADIWQSLKKKTHMNTAQRHSQHTHFSLSYTNTHSYCKY